MGGGVMRGAAKIVGGAGVVLASCLRRVSLPAGHQAFTSAFRKSFSPIARAVPSVDGASSSVAEYTTQRPSWELEFSGVEDELSVVSGEVLPRVVFGSVPTKEEAEVATLELKDSLEKVLYPVSSESNAVDGKSMLSKSGHWGMTSRSVPQPALQAFKFLSSSPEVQNVVSSIVSDENVWGAVFKNEAFVEYLESQRRGNEIQDTVTSNEVSDADLGVGNLPKVDLKCSESQHSTEAGSFFKGMVDKVKISVIDLANSVSHNFQNVFGGEETEKKSDDAGDPAVVDTPTIGSYIMGLVIMVISVVVLKRI